MFTPGHRGLVYIANGLIVISLVMGGLAPVGAAQAAMVGEPEAPASDATVGQSALTSTAPFIAASEVGTSGSSQTPDVSLMLEAPSADLQPGSAAAIRVRVENRSQVSAAGLVVRLAFDPETASLQGGNADAEIRPGLLEWQSIAVGGSDRWQRTVVLRLTQDFSAPVWLAATVEGEELYATRTAQQMLWTQDPPPVRVRVTPGMTQTLAVLGGRVQVDFPAEAVSEPLMVQLRWSRPQASDPPTVQERWELRAQNEKDEERQRFAIPLRLTLQRRLQPEGVHVPVGAMAEPMQRPVFYWLDETSGHWQDLGGRYDPASGRLEVEIDHFGAFAAGEADSFGDVGLPDLRVNAASLFGGNLQFSYPVALPSGPNGFGPQLALSYSDEVANSAWDADRERA